MQAVKIALLFLLPLVVFRTEVAAAGCGGRDTMVAAAPARAARAGWGSGRRSAEGDEEGRVDDDGLGVTGHVRVGVAQLREQNLPRQPSERTSGPDAENPTSASKLQTNAE